ncbi:MAG: hypothetical protein A2020_09690 [Lentisphaerae bacterium GWF2_45_14]|nr:MAG: hypothetical protein A2020_09690 [Lentisphaerae bacterium GWF2_45_14]
MHWIDWVIMIVPILVVCLIGLRTQRYVKDVSDFLTAGRVAGRYVIAVAGGEAAMGLISLVAIFEMYYNSGFAFSFWSAVNTPIGLVLGLTGYCVYRFRETRSMTMGQFFEIRYSKSFRIFAAVLQSASGVINYAIFPAVGARCIIYYCGMPISVNIFGMQFPTFALVMMAFLSIAILIVTIGGQVTIMVTDCIQGILSYPMYAIIVGYIIYRFSWFNEMAPTLLNRPPGQSMLNPFDIENLRTFNLFYVAVGIISSFLNRMSWCGAQGYSTAAATPHEQKMGGVLGTWRSGFSIMMYVLLAIAGFTFLNHVNYSKQAVVVHKELTMKTVRDVASGEKFAVVRAEIGDYIKTGVVSPELEKRLESVGVVGLTKKETDGKIKALSIKAVAMGAIKSEDKGKAQTFGTIYGQMLVPIAIRQILPVGITGIFCAIMIFLLVSTDTTYMHSWGGIIVQDVILPFRKKPFTPRQQLTLLRLVIAGVAVFAFCFSFFFGQVDYIIMFFAITGAIWLGGAGPCIVFGLYWKRGTTWGAYAALLSGSILAVGGFISQSLWVKHIYPWLAEVQMLDSVKWLIEGVSAPFNPYIVWRVTPDKFPINSQEIYFIAMIISVTLYVTISLLTSKEAFNMERMLHRGKYHKEGHKFEKVSLTFRSILPKLLGIDPQYTKGDRILAWSVFFYSLVYHFGAFLTIVIWNLISPWPNHWWANWFLWNSVILVGMVGAITTVWFTIGGSVDLYKLFKRLDEKVANIHDDGRVIGHVSSEDIEPPEGTDGLIH